MRSLRDQTPHFCCRSIAQEEKRDGSGNSCDVQDRHVLNEVGENHEGKTAQHHFPQLHAFAVDERDKSNRAENKTADQIPEVELEHVDLRS